MRMILRVSSIFGQQSQFERSFCLRKKKLFQSNWSLFGHEYSYDFRILNTESYFIIILKFKKYFKMLKYLKRNLTLSIITCHFYHHHYHLYYYYYFVTVITLDKYRSPHEFYLVPLMQPWRMCYIMSHCTCNAIIFNTLTTRQFLFFYWQSTIRMIDYSAELLTQLHMVYHSSLLSATKNKRLLFYFP